MNQRSTFIFTMLCFGFAFLYIPIVLVIIYSFNDSKLVTVWGGWSIRWYMELFSNENILNAALLSFRIAAITATAATIFGTMAGLILARLREFRGRMLFTGMIASPLVMPEVITGLSLLLLFVSLQNFIGWPSQRGMNTITIAHITFSMAYVAVIIQSRLTEVNESLEEAAMDLGAKPARVIWDITLPIILPAMISGWLLAFTLSLDDLVISSFVSGPGATTLPMLIFSKVRLGVSPDINALATILILMVTVGVCIAAWIINRQKESKAIS
ncbi:MAG: ABC transporter permease subunit [Gammaproteobacteria bacterium]|nr:ABC transporter permease subunit [Gammaproteobacteria bacterium]GIS86213.1 MAG: putrescine ABC transporter permease PotI [Woeseia sp.]